MKKEQSSMALHSLTKLTYFTMSTKKEGLEIKDLTKSQ
jgi:hypothetical protein